MFVQLKRDGELVDRISLLEKPFEDELMLLSQFSRGLLLVVPHSFI
jgi:hypothetical protein